MFGTRHELRLYATLILPFIVLVLGTIADAQDRYDIVLQGGRVMDPESGLDAVRNVGIRDGEVVAVSTDELSGTTVVDVTGLVVAPGFIDLHAHGQDLFSARLQAQDGVTSALELETGVSPVGPWYASKEGKAVINFGATTGHIPARITMKHGIKPGHYSGSQEARHIVAETDGSWAYGDASEQELQKLLGIMQGDLGDGALGVGLGVQYTPGASRKEILATFDLAKQNDVPVFVHTRFIGTIEPGSSIAGIQEVIADAASTGAALHIVHIGSSSLSSLPTTLKLIRGAQEEGVDVTTEVYPYTAGSTDLKSALFDEGWQDRLGIDYGDLEWVETGERLNEDSFQTYRQRGGRVVIHMMDPQLVERAVADSMVMIASDGMPFVDGRAHPRGAGTFSRVLGYYCRERGALSLMDALRKMTIMPAKRLEAAVPQMRTRGRIREGATADITVFDPETVRDRATFADPDVASAGIVHVLVNGTFVVRDGALIENAYPGVAIRRSPKGRG